MANGLDTGGNGDDNGQAGRWRGRLSAASERVRDRRVLSVTSLIGGILLGAVAVFLALAWERDGPSPEESQCASYVQGRIAWNDDDNTRWDSSWLNRLCRGTTRPAQPGLCFSSIREIPLEKGAAIQADWKDAVALCAGTENAQARIACYREGVERGMHFRDAIEQCNPPPIIAGRTACERLVQGNITWNKTGDTSWTPRRLDLLCEDTTRPTQPLLCFDRLFHGSGPWDQIVDGNWRRAAQLCAGTNSVRETTDCVTGTLADLDEQAIEPEPQIVDTGEDAPPPQSRADRLFRAVLKACNPRRPTDRSTRCKRFVQGNIPWSQDGYQDWEPAVLDELCGKTRAPQQPGLCFFRAISGEIEGDSKGESKWAYAVRLCAGTNDADARLDCYERERAAGKDSRAAIRACKEAEQD
ncbi:hypothetical protein [Dichotomicrobium thermohalophilum]|uniref:Uncharacterized protein n=1 Tax=Dichotomicrobium thermohalophilum TaxID=933063 RepID=A0A397Q9L5_9HYPH|nr:hypothetical protein [Dichotomicrobium thermohalophilum]RIA56207.1 hypothetical protein BXY53_1309 [Dichotomicrobium thermohalophilum]